MKFLTSTIQSLLRVDVVPATGCTEPACCALATAWAASQVTTNINKIEVTVSDNLLKNALEVGIPGTNGLRGLPIAVALGSLIANPQAGLELFSNFDANLIHQGEELLKKISITRHTGEQLVYAAVTVYGDEEKATAIIAGSHDQLIHLSHNGVISVEKSENAQGDAGETLRGELVKHTFKEIIAVLPKLDEETRVFLLHGLDMNLAIAREGLETPVGMGVGYYFQQLIDDAVIQEDLLSEAKKMTAAAVDARMYGLESPVMSSCGSGNQGIAATVPLYVVASRFGQGRDVLAEAIALSHLTNSYIKHYTGKLTAMCGCVTAGLGTALGTGYLLGLKRGDVTGIINNMVGNLAGIICDGAKVGCALKLATGVDCALTAALLVQRGITIPSTNGICGATPENSLINMAQVVAPGMIPTDHQILKIMLERNTSEAKGDNR
jgi:L-cysteine desulfidase